jgi:hypothetical protein
VLTAIFAVAAIAAALWSWRLIRAEGLTVRSAVWLLAILGFISLAWRSARAASVAARGGAPPRA